MTTLFKLIAKRHNQHDHINTDPGKYVEAMEPCNRKEEIGKVLRRLGTIGVCERISAPPCTFVEQVCPFPCLTAQEDQTAD